MKRRSDSPYPCSPRVGSIESSLMMIAIEAEQKEGGPSFDDDMSLKRLEAEFQKQMAGIHTLTTWQIASLIGYSLIQAIVSTVGLWVTYYLIKVLPGLVATAILIERNTRDQSTGKRRSLLCIGEIQCVFRQKSLIIPGRDNANDNRADRHGSE